MKKYNTPNTQESTTKQIYFTTQPRVASCPELCSAPPLTWRRTLRHWSRWHCCYIGCNPWCPCLCPSGNCWTWRQGREEETGVRVLMWHDLVVKEWNMEGEQWKEIKMERATKGRIARKASREIYKERKTKTKEKTLGNTYKCYNTANPVPITRETTGHIQLASQTCCFRVEVATLCTSIANIHKPLDIKS
ncbi:hypothetical protein E2C01_036663 [Portunus trituberculatus]|uniref:Uncharacterized protein n=1 Tax=Portunus trituberculatus TaxID=210409 RepID=A0A5B7FD99_PORTR|nr:hypothetical protein [Portunus trituberculatus]